MISGVRVQLKTPSKAMAWAKASSSAGYFVHGVGTIGVDVDTASGLHIRHVFVAADEHVVIVIDSELAKAGAGLTASSARPRIFFPDFKSQTPLLGHRT